MNKKEFQKAVADGIEAYENYNIDGTLEKIKSFWAPFKEHDPKLYELAISSAQVTSVSLKQLLAYMKTKAEC